MQDAARGRHRCATCRYLCAGSGAYRDPCPRTVARGAASALRTPQALQLAHTDGACAQLCDLLERLSTVPLLGRRVLLYAPLDQREAFADLLRGLGADVATAWALQPMEGVGSAGNLAGQGTDLGSFLAHALDTCGQEAPVVFIGTDCATLPCDVIVNAARDAARGAAHICPAADGGYVALALPAACPHSGVATRMCPCTCDVRVLVQGCTLVVMCRCALLLSAHAYKRFPL